ncbi:hypothetical protein [Maribellus maritimus]|uniref:hypothetical protein n=1 Tax=Maribellus maritimus TaxID=2870838 RepID=UPI001EEA1491|nr:hypothetical protein [Maribellus maritimus]MCG6191441.1 hypothetical protein [Maribellus maritimus]
MKRIFNLILITLFPILLLGCKFSLDVYQANEDYQKDVINKYDSRFINHFPKKIERLPYSIGKRLLDSKNNQENALFFVSKYPQKIIDTLYQYFDSCAVRKYVPSQKDLLIVNRFTNNENWGLKRKAKLSEIRHYTDEVDYGDKLPIPNFYNDRYINGSTECHLSPDFKLFVIEAKSGKFFPDSLLTTGKYMPKDWENGFSRGIGISKESRKVVYWFLSW